MKSETKRRILADLATSLHLFDPAAKGVFRCPVCLEDVPIEMVQRITEAHLVPLAAGGRNKTWLCQRCNSTFGTRQDKWFGEHARLRSLKNPSPFSSRMKAPTFEIGKTRVAGVIEHGPDGGIDVFIHSDRNSPETLAALEKEVEACRKAGESSLTMDLPLRGREAEIRAGYLTCAYMLWFKQLGYSFALQEHLQPIRDQILRPDKSVLPRTYMGVVPDPFPEPWLSFGYLNESPALIAGIVDRVVTLPGFNHPTLLEGLDPNFRTHNLTKMIPCPISVNGNKLMGPFGVLLDEEIFVMPDALREDPSCGVMILVLRDGRRPEILRQVSAEDFERLKEQPHVYIRGKSQRR